MITIRSIRPDEAGWFASLGDATVLDPLTGAWQEGRSRPDWTLVAEADGRPLARAALVAGPMGGGIATLEGQVGFLTGYPPHRGKGRRGCCRPRRPAGSARAPLIGAQWREAGEVAR